MAIQAIDRLLVRLGLTSLSKKSELEGAQDIEIWE